MIIEKIDALCKDNGTTLTSLCKEITGSSGNLPTWRKDNIRPDWLRKICLKFNISSDYLLELPNSSNDLVSSLSQEEKNVLTLSKNSDSFFEHLVLIGQAAYYKEHRKILENMKPDGNFTAAEWNEASVEAILRAVAAMITTNNTVPPTENVFSQDES